MADTTLMVLQIAGNFDADFIEHLPPTCKFICHNGAGMLNMAGLVCTAKRSIF